MNRILFLLGIKSIERVLLFPIDSKTSIQLITIITTFGLAISSFEYVVNVNKFADTNILSWRISKFHGKWPLRGHLSMMLNYILEYEKFKIIIILRFVLILILLATSFLSIISSTLLFLVLFTTLLINIRSPFGLDGSYHMNLIILVCLFISSFFSFESLPSKLCISFIALQSIISYFIAGISKAFSPHWQNGAALIGIFSTSIYGHPSIFNFFRSQAYLTRPLSWFIIAFECSFPLVLLLDFQYGVIILIMGFLFHIFTAVFMGLNGFLFAFVATYPAIIYVSSMIS